MKVRLERTFAMPAPADATWAVLSDIAEVAACMPGAKITAKVDDTHYKGTVSIKLGPANLSFRGEIEVLELTPATRTMHLAAKGTDTTGSSFASMDLIARVEATDDGLSALTGTSEASVGGKAAAFGNRMMDAVSDQILKQFAANFAARVAALQPAAVEASPAPVESMQTSAPAASTAPTIAAAPTMTAAPPARASSPTAMAPAAPAELNGLALLWAIIRDWFGGLFSKRR